MSKQRGYVSIQIEEKLKQRAMLSREPSKCCIFRVNAPLRKENEEAYDPEIVAIGPYHHGKENLQWMEEHKLWYLQQLLKQREQSDDVIHECFEAMRASEIDARNCYETIKLNSDEFVEMMVLDGCFIVLFLLNLIGFSKNPKCVTDKNYLITQTGTIRMGVRRDLLLQENQLPFFVLEKLFDKIKDPNNPRQSFIDVAQAALAEMLRAEFPVLPEIISGISTNIVHLLSLAHKICCLPYDESMTNSSNGENREKKFWGVKKNIIRLLDMVCNLKNNVPFAKIRKERRVENVDEEALDFTKWTIDEEELDFIKCTIDLQAAGIKFKRAEKTVLPFDIKFENGVLTIPTLQVTDGTECHLRNLISLEQCPCYEEPKHVTNYMAFMDRLIDSPKDVEQLRDKGIIKNWLGDDEAVSTMVNKLGNHVGLDTSNFSYKKIFLEANRHCGNRGNIWLEKLNREYFHSPWSIISVLAAFVLLLFTLVQTIFSILSYVKS